MSCGAKLQPDWTLCGPCRERDPNDNACHTVPVIRGTGIAPEGATPGAGPAEGFQKSGCNVAILTGVLLTLTAMGTGPFIVMPPRARGALLRLREALDQTGGHGIMNAFAVASGGSRRRNGRGLQLRIRRLFTRIRSSLGSGLPLTTIT
jgi:hypothetical protein